MNEPTRVTYAQLTIERVAAYNHNVALRNRVDACIQATNRAGNYPFEVSDSGETYLFETREQARGYVVSRRLHGTGERAYEWSAELQLGTTSSDLGVNEFSGALEHSFPSDTALHLLNDLANDGWRVVHVSEDRTVAEPHETGSGSFVTRARFLLTRA